MEGMEGRARGSFLRTMTCLLVNEGRERRGLTRCPACLRLQNTNRETTDTGPVYTYQRLAFLGENAAGPSVVPDISNHTGNLILANYGSTVGDGEGRGRGG